MRKLIINGNIITPFEIREKSHLEIEDGVIKNILSQIPIDFKAYDEVIDAKGNFVSPGFIDIHTHGAYGYDSMEGTEEAIGTIGRFHRKNGVTSFLANVMTDSPERMREAIKRIAHYMGYRGENIHTTAQLLGIYLEGPYFSREKAGAQPREHVKLPNLEEIKEFVSLSENRIKVVALAPELEGAEEVIGYLKSKNIAVSAGHTMATFKETKEAIDLGVTLATHLYNGMRDFNHREVGVVGAVLTDERVMCEIIADGIHVHPEAIGMAVELKGKDKIVLISDSMMAAGLSDGEYTLAGQKVYVKNKEARIESGNLAGSTLTLDRAIYNMVHLVGVKLEDAVRMATLNPAKAIGVDSRKGSIEIGKDADLVIFDENMTIEKVFIKGM